MKMEAEQGSGGAVMASWHSRPDDAMTRRQFWQTVLVFSLVAILWQLAAHFIYDTDYVGLDPDDTMRLVEIRDYLAGQDWFDLHQYRLGLADGTLMHWSRLIDFPIAMLIRFFALFTSSHAAEALALTVWPLVLIVPLMAAAGLGAYRLGGRAAMMIALLFNVLLVASIVRFRPGAIDHHNVQLILVLFITAMLMDPQARWTNFAAAGIAGAIGLAIGVETTPLIGVAALATALLWAAYGPRYQKSAIGFGLGFAGGSAALFLATVPPSLYASVTCDTLSIGYASLAGFGGVALAFSAALASHRRPAIRLGALTLTGLAALALMLLIAPQCLSNPLDALDPLLVTMWLNGITEAQSIVDEVQAHPQTLGTTYAVGLIAALVCILRIRSRQAVLPHAVLLALILTAWATSAYQVRFGIFTNFLGLIPLAALVAALRARYLENQTNVRAALAFVLAALVSLPSVWTIVGAFAFEAGNAIAGTNETKKNEIAQLLCPSEAGLQPLVDLPRGRILSTSNPGSALLRFTPHSVLTANYHRNQAGMLAALRMGIAAPDQAYAMIRRENVTYLTLCDADKQYDAIVENHPDSLFAAIHADHLPSWLVEIPSKNEVGLRLFKIEGSQDAGS